ncbi:bifunctional phosphopantothenoylcysteine decarboxylase/phosphopantothenate--cysteine ligase CoaBC [Bacillaceae bacterium Marseille-Q3522]|nr:bifunctional phosphopantothenoylcysteine decarboxylase/phosphopantothenate--cysteine ligase CoaBC [Bacillaceae bacterium Marseille-Q3522]
MLLKGKKILLGVSGGIAVYKACALTSKLTQAGAEVKVIMSEAAVKFVPPLTFQALSRNEVYIDTFDEKDSRVIAHIDLADWSDAIIVAPATANTIGKLANGIADNMLTTTLLAATSPVWIAPAMNVHMYGHPAVQKNMQTLKSFGYRFIEPGVGYLACGYTGKGRMEEPENILYTLEQAFKNEEPVLKGMHVLVTAGPTQEKIDPVRYITNHSSGKMGYAIAKQALLKGADVTLISGPVAMEAPAGAEIIKVVSAEEMYQAAVSRFAQADIVIKTAAVADYKPKKSYENKMKKQSGPESLELERTKDILLELGKRKTSQILVGFAAETDQLETYAREKLEKKNLDLLVANNIKENGAGFGSDTNIVTLFRKDGSKESLPLLTKTEVAEKIIAAVLEIAKDEQV